MTTSQRMRAGALALALAASGCAMEAPEGQLIADPYEGFNRGVHAFNVGVDRFALRPASQAYDFATPGLIKHLTSNAVDHVRLPVIFVNHLLQGEFQLALETFGRFSVNTVAGAAGLLDPATEFGLPLQETDFGLTLASHGVEEGPFLMLPFFGPSTGRDAVGVGGDIALDPFTYAPVGSGSGRIAYRVGTVLGPPIVDRHRNREIVDRLLYESEDSYVAVRSAYVQFRRGQAAGEEVDPESLPDIFGE